MPPAGSPATTSHLLQRGRGRAVGLPDEKSSRPRCQRNLDPATQTGRLIGDLGGPLELVADAALDEAAAETGAGRLLDPRSAALAPVDGKLLTGAVAGDGPGQVERTIRGRQGTVAALVASSCSNAAVA